MREKLLEALKGIKKAAREEQGKGLAAKYAPAPKPAPGLPLELESEEPMTAEAEGEVEEIELDPALLEQLLAALSKKKTTEEA